MQSSIFNNPSSIVTPFAPHRYRSKNQLARILVYKVVRKGLRFDVLVFDSWYAGADNLRLFNRLGITWVTAIACNRILLLPLSEPIRHRHGKPTTHEKLSVQQWAARFPYRSQYTPYPSVDLRAKHLLGKLLNKLPEVMLVVVKDYAKSRSFQQEVELLLPHCRPKVSDLSEKGPQQIPDNQCASSNCALKRGSATALSTGNPLLSTPMGCGSSLSLRLRRSKPVLTLKQQCALGACQARKFEKVTRHIAFSFLGYVCLQQLRIFLVTNGKVTKEATLGDVQVYP